jgi:hypothetical protein
MTPPRYKLSPADIKHLKLGLGGCVATNRITVEGLPVRFMYRGKPSHPSDSGWNFWSGVNEDDDYTSNPDNFSVFDVNTIANYDPSIIPFLDAPLGSVFERTDDKWLPVTDWSPLD